MLRLAFIVVIFLQTGWASAQRLKRKDLFVKKGMMGVMSGPAFPILDFADANFKPASGYATTGYNIKASLCYDIMPNIGLALQYQYNSLPFNSKDFLADLQNANNSSIYRFHSYQSKSWTLQGMLIGVYYPLRTYRTTIDIKLLGGFLTGVLPENTVNYTYIPDNIRINLLQYEASATNLAFNAGANIRYQLYKNLLLIGSLDFSYTEIEFTNIIVRETLSGIMLSAPNYTQYYHLINGSAGIAIQFE